MLSEKEIFHDSQVLGLTWTKVHLHFVLFLPLFLAVCLDRGRNARLLWSLPKQSVTKEAKILLAFNDLKTKLPVGEFLLFFVLFLLLVFADIFQL